MKGFKDISDYSFTFSIPEAKINNKALKKMCGFADPEIEKVIFNPPATIVLWSDHTKTVVKCMDNDIYSPEAGLALCISKKFLGEDFKKTFRKWIPCGRPEKPETDIPKREKTEKEKEEESTWDWCMRILRDKANRDAMNFEGHDFTGEDEIDIPKTEKDIEAKRVRNQLESLFEAFDRMCTDFEGHDFTGEDEMQYKK